EFDIAAKRQRRDAPARAIAVIKAKEFRPKAKREGFNLHAAPPANQKMPELVEENHKAQDKEEGQHIAGNRSDRCDHSILIPPRLKFELPVATMAWLLRKAQ